ncbi:hypothetical protein F5B19DRAFT_493302 [Rostrohypoxylon terebratum]|nr:hypothetical protein F5B19DRAFT_493302 [Rostrohypoxylon terebratum]
MASTQNTQTTQSTKAGTQTNNPASSGDKSKGSEDKKKSDSSGRYYRFRCKYFLTHNCPNWVWVNRSPCAMCCAEGRDNPSKDEDKGGENEGQKEEGDNSRYGSPVEDGESHGNIGQCEKCHCWTDDREHTCVPEDKDKYAKDGQ